MVLCPSPALPRPLGRVCCLRLSSSGHGHTGQDLQERAHGGRVWKRPQGTVSKLWVLVVHTKRRAVVAQTSQRGQPRASCGRQRPGCYSLTTPPNPDLRMGAQPETEADKVK